MTKRQLFSGGILVTCVAWPALRGQERPLTVNGTLSTGYYSTSTRGDATQSLSFAPVGARFEMTGYVLSPELMSLSAEPELHLGPQASDAGFQGGNGIRVGVTLLRKSVAPLTFRYSNIQLEDAYFGGLTQISGYTLQDRNRDLGLSWEIKPGGLPSTTVDWESGSVDSKSGTPGIPDYTSNGSHFNVDSQWQKAGWELEGFLHRNRQTSDVLMVADGTQQTGSLSNHVLQYQGTVRRGFFGDSEFFVEGGSQSTASVLFDYPIDLGTRYLSANLRLAQKHRWKTLVRALYSSNVTSQMLAQAASSLTGIGATAPNVNVLTPFTHGMANLNLNAMTSYTLGRGFAVYDSVEQSSLFSSSLDAPLNSNYLTNTAGVTYAGRVRWANFAGDYAREFGAGSLIGQNGSISGQHYSFSASHKSSNGLNLETSVHGNTQDVHTAAPLSNDSMGIEGSVGERVAGDFSVQAGGGWEWSTIVNAANQFRSNGYTAHAGIQHPRFQINAAINDSLSNSLPFYNQAAAALGLNAVVLAPAQVIPSDYRALTLTLHANPARKFEISGSWTRSAQHLDGILSNNFQLLDVFVTYRFRKVQVESGYILSTQIFSYYPSTIRKRFYVRFVRSARIL